MIFMLDNYDSFTYNLVQYFQVLGQEVRVERNDKITVEQVLALQPAAVVVSPGPCSPNEAGISVPLIQAVSGKLPLFGVCLGHQSMGVAYGGRIIKAKRVLIWPHCCGFVVHRHSASPSASQPMPGVSRRNWCYGIYMPTRNF